MKIENYVEKIRLKVEDAVKNTLDRCGITDESNNFSDGMISGIEIGNVEQLIESIISEKHEWKECFDEIVDDYTFTLFNRLVCMKVMESQGLYPEMITQNQQYSGKSYGHYLWLEINSQYKNDAFEGLDKYISYQFHQLSEECDLFNTTIPLHLIPTATFLKEIIDLINSVDEDDQINKDIWKQGNILSQIYEIYNNSKKFVLKESGEKVEYDKVHIQSQIYTPEWVVKFLVNNSLGKLYLEMYPDSKIKDTHKIIGDFSNRTREIKPLDEIKIIDPCVGSGNFLLYGFDLFYDMYIDQIENYGADYSKRDIPKLIIEKNLHGIDLDERAVQLTKVGLFIKAKTKRSSVHIDHYNVVSASFRLPEFNEIDTLFDAQFFSKDFNDLLSDVWKDLQQAHKFGSLLRIDEKFESKTAELKQELGEAQLSLFTYEKVAEFDLFANNFYEKLGDAIKKYAVDEQKMFFAEVATVAMTYLKIITGNYDVVVSNPPYTDSAAYSGTELADFLEKNYRKPLKFTGNLYACFYRRNYSLLNDNGLLGMIHPMTFMYIPTFEDMRKHIVNNMSMQIFVEYGLSNLFGVTMVDPVFYVFRKKKNKGELTPFISLDQYTRTAEEKNKKKYCLEALECIVNNSDYKDVIYLCQEEFRKIDGFPFIYNISSEFREKFQKDKLIKYADVRAGIQTSKNERFLRLWWEVGKQNVREKNDNKRWVRYDKGGPYVKWYGNNWCTIDWLDEGKALQRFLKENGQDLHAQEYYFRKGITYSASGSKGITFREHSELALFDIGGSCVFPTDKFKNIYYLMALLNSRLSGYILKDCLNPTVNTQPKDLKRLPFVVPEKNIEEDITFRAMHCVEIKKKIDEKYILNGADTSPLNIVNSVADALKQVILEEIASYCDILINEAVIDRKICHTYDLNNEDLRKVANKKGECVAVLAVDTDALNSFIDEYEVDNTFIQQIEQYKMNEDEINDLIKNIKSNLFTQNNGLEDFCVLNKVNPITVWYLVNRKDVIPISKAHDLVFEWLLFALRDMLSERTDGIIPLTSTDTPIVHLLEKYADKKGITSAQLLQMEEFLGKKIRDFVEKDFFVELMNYTNVFMYLPKTPFIWHLSSGEKRGFEALVLIYMWNADSLYRLKSNYISKRREKLEFRRTQLSSSNTAQALDEKELIDRQLNEIEDFVSKIDELIAEGYNPTLDDGVGKNIAPLQDKKMLKADVLNANQLKKYLKAEW